MPRTPSRILLVAGALTASATLAACGGSGDDHRPAVSHAQPTGVPSGAPATRGKAGSGKATGDVSASGAANEGGRSAARSPVGYEKLVEQQARKPQHRFTPCGLVSRAQASAILGAKVAIPTEAPQGPRCIYRANRSRGLVTVTVVDGTLKAATHGQQRRSAITVAGRTGVCGTLGHTELSIAVSGGRVLSIAAPCGIAKQFAAKAIPQLKD
jgi:hypothetical protein